MNDTMNVQDLFNERIEQNKRIEELVNIVEKLSLALKSAEDKFLENFNESVEWCRYKDKEIERLNNIIDELETYCNIVIGMNFNMNNDVLSNQKVEDYTKVLDRLKELKGSDKDENN